VARYRQFSKPREKFPWWWFLALIAAVYIFWVLPYQLGTKPVVVTFEQPKK
jgi:hypothetical protein